MKIIFILLFLFATIKLSYSQNLDSLKIVLQTQKKSDIYNKISSQYLDFDSDSAKLYADTALFLAKKENNNLEISNAYANIANSFYYKSDLDSALFYYKKSSFQ